MDADGVQVSRRGVSVLTASLDEMTFDSRFASIGMAISGSRKLNKRRSPTGQPAKTAIAFGRNFGQPPMFLFGWTYDFNRHLMRFPASHAYNTKELALQYQVDAQIASTRVTFINWVYPIKRLNNGVTVYWKAFV